MVSICPKLLGRIKGYCTRSWFMSSIPSDLFDDCTQDVFCRITQIIPLDKWEQCLINKTEEHAELVRAVDNVAHIVQRRIKGGTGRKRHKEERLVETTTEDRTIEKRERTAILILCIRSLSLRRRIILLMLLSGHNTEEISRRTGMRLVRISDEKWKAMKQLRTDERLQQIR